MSILKDPLLHVLLAGIAIYLLYMLVEPDSADPNQIRVDRPALIEFIRDRSQELAAGAAEARLDAMPRDQLEYLIQEFIREQALYREALGLGLDREDYVMRRRLVQRLESTLQALASDTAQASEQALVTYFNVNRESFFRPARITFTHVFLDPKRRSEQALAGQAQELLGNLREERVQFSQALGYGDAFVYHRNYVDRPRGDIVSHFGEDMAQALFSLAQAETDDREWIGPLESVHGTHLVLIQEFTAGGVPNFSVLRAEIERDFLRERARQNLDATVQRIIEKYPVTLELDS